MQFEFNLKELHDEVLEIFFAGNTKENFFAGNTKENQCLFMTEIRPG